MFISNNQVMKLIEKKTKINEILKTGEQFRCSTLTQCWLQSLNRASKNSVSFSNIFKSNGIFKRQVYSWKTSNIWNIWGKQLFKIERTVLMVDIKKTFDSVNLKSTRKLRLYSRLFKVDKYFASGILPYKWW